MPKYKIQIRRKPTATPQEYEIEAADIHEAGKKIHSVKKYGADKACEIQIKGLGK